MAAQDTKKVFISYRRTLSIDFAARIRDRLKDAGYDTFFDVESIPSGKFAEIIFHAIEERPLFVPVLVPGSFERTTNKDDWFRREIEFAISKNRYIVPVAKDNFSLDDERKRLHLRKLPGRLSELKEYQFIKVPDRFFKAAMDDLIEGLTHFPKNIDIVPTSKKERKVINDVQEIANSVIPSSDRTNWILPQANLFASSHLNSLKALSAPELTLEATPMLRGSVLNTLKWSPVAEAGSYILQRSDDDKFSKAQEIYRGDKTEYLAFDFLLSPKNYYRVKATGLLSLLNPWSNVIEIIPNQPRSSLFTGRTALSGFPNLTGLAGISAWRPFETFSSEKPELSYSSEEGGKKLTWTSFPFATNYVLESSYSKSFSNPHEEYRGSQTEYPITPYLFLRSNYYRVKADGLSQWSDVVEVKPAFQARFNDLLPINPFFTEGFTGTTTLAAPTLQQPKVKEGLLHIEWNKIDNATEYVLQSSDDNIFSSPIELYHGSNIHYDTLAPFDPSMLMVGRRFAKPRYRYYRVKAVSLGTDSPWSKVVASTL